MFQTISSLALQVMHIIKCIVCEQDFPYTVSVNDLTSWGKPAMGHTCKSKHTCSLR